MRRILKVERRGVLAFPSIAAREVLHPLQQGRLDCRRERQHSHRVSRSAARSSPTACTTPSTPTTRVRELSTECTWGDRRPCRLWL